MYDAARGLLRLAAVMAFVAGGLVCYLISPYLGLAVVVWCVAALARRTSLPLTTLGSARWADERDLERAGMLGGDTGLILGRITADKRSYPCIQRLFSRWTSAREACREFWNCFRPRHARVVRLPQAIHTAVFGPSGRGKGVSFVIPFLLTCDESCVVIDFKGENAQKTAQFRRERFGHEIVLLDPFQVTTRFPESFNPLADIRPDDPLAIDECNDLAKALVVRPPEEKEPHWNDSAEAWIAGLLAMIVRYGEEDLRSLQTLKEFVSHPQRLEIALRVMCESDAWGGMLARLGGQLSHFVEREKASTLSTVARHLRFLDSPTIAACTKRSTFDPARLRSGKMTVYLILPPDHMRAQSSLLRMWIGGLLRAVIRGGLQEQHQVHFVLDEAASLGRLEPLEDAVDKYRGYGVRLQFYYQSPGQLKSCFPNGADQTLLSNTTQVYFAVNDHATADLVSSRLGEQTIVVQSGSQTTSYSLQTTSGLQMSESHGQSSSSTSSWQQQARKLLKPEEVTGLHERWAITFAPGAPPVCTELLRYYEEPWLTRPPPSRFRENCLAVLALAGAALALAGNTALVWGALQVLLRQPTPAG